jgi:signal transduction histidine kinase/DNA-binding NarL/FixJ family response regulator
MKDTSLARKAMPEFLNGGGEMGQRIREYDWAKTPLGPIDTWPKSLQTCIRIMLTSQQPIWIGWGKELIKFYNDPYRAIVGGKHPWALGQPASEVWKEIWTGVAPMLRQVMEEDRGTYVEEELLIMERNGYPEETYYTFSYTPIPGDDGGTAGMICANTDDTDKVQSRRQIETLTVLGKTLSDSRKSADVFEKTLVILAENPKDFTFAVLYLLEGDTARLFDISSAAPHPEGFPVTFNLRTQSPFSERLFQAAHGLKPVALNWNTATFALPRGPWAKASDQVMIMPVHKGGSKKSVGFFVIGTNPHRLIEGKYRSFFDLVNDQVSTSLARAHAYEEEQKRLEALAEIDRAKTTFFSNISHEFRTPLTLLLGPIEDALHEPQAIEANTARMEVALRNALRMQKLVNMLLDFSRIEAGRMDAQIQSIDIATFTEGLVSAFRSAIEKAGMALIVECRVNGAAHVDPDMWEKIILNLVSNAFKYSRHGHIRVALTEQDDQLILTVSDTGSGIPESELEKIFERFHRVQNVQSRSQEGTGIGLAMVKELVKLHQGTIDVSSKVGHGSTFRISIPRRAPDADRIKPATPETPTNGHQTATFLEDILHWGIPAQDKPLTSPAKPAVAPLTGFKVLLADDNHDMRQHIERLLAKFYTVITVSNGEEAYTQILQRRPDLVISDIMMPVLDGFGLLQKIRGNADIRNTPVIFLSARAGEEAVVEGLNAGADDYLIKPFSSKELLAKISSQIKISKSRADAELQLRRLFNQAPVAITIIKRENYVVELANEFYLELVEKDHAFIGKSLFESLPELTTQGIQELLDGVIQSGQSHIGKELRLQLRRKGQMETVFFNFVYHPLFEEDGTVSGVFVVAVEVTDLVTARESARENAQVLEKMVIDRTRELQNSAEQLMRANETLLGKNKELEQFAYISSHDLQEPLRKIQTFSELVARHITDEDYATKYLEKIDASAARMSALIKDILAYSKISNTETQQEQIDLNKVLEHVKTDFELLISEKQAHIVSTQLPTVKGNRFQFHQLFSNLISNSLKFTEVAPIITISSEVVEGPVLPDSPAINRDLPYHRLLFQDNGIGFEKEYSEQIFGMFQRLQNRKDYSGTGIGLALCRKIVESHGGIISAESAKGKGARFIVYLPVL